MGSLSCRLHIAVDVHRGAGKRCVCCRSIIAGDSLKPFKSLFTKFAILFVDRVGAGTLH